MFSEVNHPLLNKKNSFKMYIEIYMEYGHQGMDQQKSLRICLYDEKDDLSLEHITI